MSDATPAPTPTATRVMLARVAANLAIRGRERDVQVWCDRYWRLRTIEEWLLRRLEREPKSEGE